MTHGWLPWWAWGWIGTIVVLIAVIEYAARISGGGLGRRKEPDIQTIAIAGFQRLEGQIVLSSVKNVAHAELIDGDVVLEFDQPIDPSTAVIRVLGTAQPVDLIEKTSRRVRFKIAQPIEARERVYVIDGRFLS